MDFILSEQLTDPKTLEAIRQLLILGDLEFIPPLSSRSSSTQSSLGNTTPQGSIESYFETIRTMPAVLALDGSRVAGFMTFRFDYTCDQIGPETLPNLYASTCIVHPDYRGQGLMTGFYTTMLEHYPQRGIYTRTWHTNYGHLKVLDRLGFSLLCCLENHRGKGIHTVYYGRKP